MKKIVLLILVLTTITISVNAQEPIQQPKQSNKTSPKTSNGNKINTQPKAEHYETLSLSKDSLSRLKAVLVVGPSEDVTQKRIDEFKKIASYLRSLGIQVTEFYHPQAKWTDIINSTKGAHIFIYSGHGTNSGEQGKSGGVCLSDGTVSSESIFKEIKLHKNALVLFYQVCLAAGSSASDNADIGIKLAVQRVSDYSFPFVKLGIGGYYANNYDKSLNQFLIDFLNKKNIKQIYENEASSFCHIEITQTYIDDPKYLISVASNIHSGIATRTIYENGKKKVEKVPRFKEYNIAFVSIPGFTVLDFFK